MSLSIIVAIDDNNGIGKEGGIPWFYKEDMQFFARTTKGAACVMGRITYDSIFEKMGVRENLLPGRQCFVVTRNKDLVPQGALRCSSLSDAARRALGEDLFVIGGAGLYTEALHFAGRVYITRVPGNFNCDVSLDTFMAELERQWVLEASTTSETGLRYESYTPR